MNTGDYIGTDRGERIIDTGSCPTATCGNHVYVPVAQYERLRQTGDRFYCPAGHGQSFTARPVIDARVKRAKEAEAALEQERRFAKAAQERAERAARTCPWPTCEGRVLASPLGLAQHMVKAHGAPWLKPELSR